MDGLVTLADADQVFPDSVLTESARTITRAQLPGYEVLCEARERQIKIQPSVEAFKRTFDRMSDGLLKGIDWNNVVVAGGIVLGTLVSVDSASGHSLEQRWTSSDIDIYIYGLSPSAANEKVQHLFTTFNSNLPSGTPTLAVRNCNTITFYAHYPLRRIQIVLKLVESPRAVLLNFDLDICAMGWDGSQVWMLPRAARALETGCSVFTMDLIDGHYLSDRRASEPERIFKYADKGYGIRFLPSYISALDDLPAGPLMGLHATKQHFDIHLVASETRDWMEDWVRPRIGRRIRHSDLDTTEHRSLCLAGFSFFMRHVGLWEMAQRKEVTIETDSWASTSYTMTTNYDDTPQPKYKWNSAFTIAGFKSRIDLWNKHELEEWAATDVHYPSRLETHGFESYDLPDTILSNVRRMAHAPTIDTLLAPANDIQMQLLLPCRFADYANALANEVLQTRGVGLPGPPSAGGAPRAGGGAPNDNAEGLYLWRIPAELMWQQLDRRIDELFEVLYAFRRVNEHLRVHPSSQAARLLRVLSKRRTGGNDELAAFAKWMLGAYLHLDDFARWIIVFIGISTVQAPDLREPEDYM
ncbi:hypothetical protein C8J57DRAFT_1061528 [Mycena rebaudengoi]|nr:hypothetical protein C8J57DRAFT_1061528 [Mycena rebaudengoi]